MTPAEMTREQLLDHATRCAACGACDTDLLTALETSPDGEVAEHVRLSHDRTWRSILRRALPTHPTKGREMTETEMCPGHVGRGTGTHCCMCRLPIPPHMRRTADSPPDTRPGCTDCQRGLSHVHCQRGLSHVH